MDHPLKTAVDRLPAILEKNAPTIMRRMVARMKDDMGRSDVTGNVSHGLLFLKVGEEDLVAAFVVALREAFKPAERGAFDTGVLLSLETEEGGTDADFAASTAAYDALCETARTLGIRGMARYGKDAFVAAMKDAFARSRMDTRATAELMPYARPALDAELRGLYLQLQGLAQRTA